MLKLRKLSWTLLAVLGLGLAVSCEEEFFEIKNEVTKPILILDPIYENITKSK